MNEAVRSAASPDAGDIEHLEIESRTAIPEVRGGPRWLELHPAVGDAWGRRIERGGVLVATFDGAVVGYLDLDVDQEVATVAQVYVTPDAREIGFGDALVGEAMERARRDGCSVLEGFALPGDRNTKNLYERAGITARLITVSRRL